VTSKLGLKNVFRVVDDNYRRCWDILREFKQKPSRRILEFQPLLCQSLLLLNEEYRKISKERKRLISKKTSLKPTWFQKKQKTLDLRQDAIRRARGIGHALGNSFAWVFYQHEPTLLEEHAKHPLTDSIHPGIGGIGERELLTRMPVLDGCLILHHNTTTILRIGDISLIDLKSFRVGALGEIKTSRDDSEHISVQLEIIGDREFLADRKKTPSTIPLPGIASCSEKARHARQMVRMGNAVAKRSAKDVRHNLELLEERHNKEFSELLALAATKRNRFTAMKIGDGLLCMAYGIRRNKLSEGLFRGKIDCSTVSILDKQAPLIIHPESECNAMWISEFCYSREGAPIHFSGTVPLFWWNLDPDMIRRIIFQELIILTVFNPAHFAEKLKKKGFDVTLTQDKQNLDISMQLNDARMKFASSHHYVNMIVHGLYSEDLVVQIIESLANETKLQAKQNGSIGRIDVRFNHALWRPK
jgi:hypothetical protein